MPRNIAYPPTLYEPRNWILRPARRAMGCRPSALASFVRALKYRLAVEPPDRAWSATLDQFGRNEAMRTIAFAGGHSDRRAGRRGAANAMTRDQPGHQARRQDRRRAGVQRLGLHRQERVAGALLVGRAEGRQELRRQHVRSRRADRQRLLALVGRQYSRRASRPCQRAQAAEPDCRAGACRAAQRFQPSRIWRPVPAKGQAASLRDHRLCAQAPTSSTSTQNASAAVFGFNANAHTLAKATLTGLYGR